ncbi:hypothetical protein K7957_10310 [Sphingomonas yunnanensis]|uniref:hypothetical protein n=1 Tax=Sphingomonas yunnanensis TaxID=310400 RepID=UPI001CA79626|nr:hypothetical protein [Sphingomonas yunnanensis]MBY9063322.1 hypothetical protein [Sphingomonas yunnanensis]
MLRRTAPLPDHELVPLVSSRRVDESPRWCRVAAAVAAGTALLALGSGLPRAAALAVALAGALLCLLRRVERRHAAALAARLAATGDAAITHRWCRAGPGAIALAEGNLVWLIDRSTAYQVVRLAPEQITAAMLQRDWRGWRVALLYRLEPHEVARRSLICFGRHRAAADALVAHLTRR